MKSSRQAAVFSALHLLNDPQDFSEKLFHKLEGSKDKFEVKLMMMSLISRLVGLHQVYACGLGFEKKGDNFFCSKNIFCSHLTLSGPLSRIRDTRIHISKTVVTYSWQR